ncbi:MAG: hypothetical protein WHU10_12600, partial [Fimbriimonadales bacterium]
LEANRLVLEDLEPSVRAEVDAASRVEGRVVLGEGTVVEGSTVRGPAVIGRGCRIVGSYVGPFTSIADNVTLVGTEIENSIVLPDSRLENVPSRIEGSLIGRGVSVVREGRVPRSIQIVIGDSGSLSLP